MGDKKMAKTKLQLTPSEKRILRRIREWIKAGPDANSQGATRYDFWFVFDEKAQETCTWEGGWSYDFTPVKDQFRNEYSIILATGKLVKNW
jgi:hypothetical protein